MNESLFTFIAFVDLQNQELKENLKFWKEKSQEATQEVEKLRNTLNEIKKKCSKYQTCIIVLKKDILDIINKAKEQ